ncbi:MAG TPA: ABC transporter permease [Steroidobacteraceae bacterium]|nr:ABC transporter permease [Steroidobacteraceae bacterium]
MIRLYLERRAVPSRVMGFVAPALAVLAMVLCAIPMLRLAGLAPLATLRVFFIEPLSSANGVSEWLLKANPLVLMGLGLMIGYRANVWNIGAEGMYTVGAICAAWMALRFADGVHHWLLAAMMLAGMLGGMLWAAIPAFLKTRLNTSEILVSLMLTYVAQLLLSWLVNGPMQDPQGLNYPQTALFSESATFSPLIAGMRLNASVFITLGAVPLAWLLLQRSFLGFQLKVSGAAPSAARYAGFAQGRLTWIALLIGGATAGLAGMFEAAGPLGQLSPVISPGYGFAAIIVAFIGRLRPVGVLLGGLLLSLLYLGGEAAQMSMNVPAAMSRSFQGLLLLCLLATDVLVDFRIRLRP